MPSGVFWVGVVVSAAAWWLGDALAGLLFSDGTSRFIAGFLFAVLGGGLVMLWVRMRALRSGRYEKGTWGVRRR